ncbi:GH3 family domain-containing protein [Roseateles sp. NT4]|uniref:GH3 family domain-containing protein n=1 Tax=Roseateles sp. NT4 TaxID=3453715 RepID=UPI003EEE2F2C
MAEASFAAHLAGEAAALRALLDDAEAVQAAHLAAILERNRDTTFGRLHGFAEGAAHFAAQMPVCGYDTLEPWITRVADGEAGVLTAEPVLAFEETGGSTAGGKLVPYTASGLAEFQAGLRPWLDDLFMAFPALDAGSFYWSISPACRPARAAPGGLPIGLGSDAAYFGEALVPSILRTLAVGPEVGTISDVDEWQRQTLAQLGRRRDLAMISVWSPTFLTQLLEALPDADHRTRWPQLQVISCWDQAASAPFAATLREAFPGVCVQGKGLLATEGLVTIPLIDQPWPVVSPRSGYYEFRDAIGAVHGIAGVQTGQDYELLITNANGFYRYAIGDRVRVQGFVGQAPMLEFIGRGQAATDLCGEKLTEAFVMQLLQPLGLSFAALALDTTASGYVLLADAAGALPASERDLLDRAEQGLACNPQYAYARRVGQLRPLRLERIQQPIAHWTRLRQARGQRLGDIKPPVLIGDADYRALQSP